ncbi:MAG: hypothetical protein V1655_00670 [bacterium]
MGFSNTEMGFSTYGMGLTRFVIPALIVRRAMAQNKRLEQFVLVFLQLLVDLKPKVGEKVGELDFVRMLMDGD